jgi:hypothetical protein
MRSEMSSSGELEDWVRTTRSGVVGLAAAVLLVSQVQAVSFYLVRCVGVLSVLSQNTLLCDWSAWIRLGGHQGPKKGR